MHLREELSFTEILCCTHTLICKFCISYGEGVWILHINTFPLTQLKYFYALLVLSARSCRSMDMLNFFLFFLPQDSWVASIPEAVCGGTVQLSKMKSLCMLWKHMGVRRYRSTLNISTVWRWVLNFTSLLLYQLFSLYSLNRRLVGP